MVTSRKVTHTFAEYVLISNRVKGFMRIDKHEIRTWVIKVPHLPVEAQIINLLKNLGWKTRMSRNSI
jgi:hypothetical protein